MTIADAAKITRKAEQAERTVANLKGDLATLASGEFTAKKLGELALNLAAAEGALTVWANLRSVSDYHTEQGTILDNEGVLAVVSELLLHGADDTWSGRGNDVARARFDGVREACRHAKWML